MNGLKEWRCREGHVLGLILDKNGINTLILFRWAVDEKALAAGEVGEADDLDVIANIEGKVVDVRCSICDSVRSWFPDAKLLKKMMRRNDG